MSTTIPSEAALGKDAFTLLSASLEIEAAHSSNAAPSHQLTRRTTIPCCLCGTIIYPNAANQCEACLAQKFDLHQLLNRGFGGQGSLTLHQCRDCRRYERSQQGESSSQSNRYERCELESSELMALCLKHIPALSSSISSKGSNSSDVRNLQIVEAAWVWTEPHSMRLKLRLTVRANICDGTVQILQRVIVEFVVRFKQCLDCQREFTNKVSFDKGFLMLY
jgi:nonsense-mediated mRNA decay protein 3